MPKVVDRRQRRKELAAAVWRVIVRDGVAEVSIRSVAAESGWSTGALRHYFATRAELLAFACEEVIAQVTDRLATMPVPADLRAAAGAVLLETMPVDERRRTEAEIAFAFLALGLRDPALARVQRLHFGSMFELCLRLVTQLAPGRPAPREAARHLHALVDGLTVHVLAGHLGPAEAIDQLNAHLDTLAGPPGGG
ncbi:TetR/AcrR family transcriptional regulator [Paractinoplanes rhizophilus]|jgi:AcrR family transcriptional regulator|uniref:TetR/AcrR family transcriptional regulator n=1 Tax=Paractinoplanes rhizophilus TaxID=1416877 RepID=A0ABW2HP30_9ACTN|nr:TetR family transcriptional regulator C-terminal domain-containing protein [Actinoplanes sp.]